MASRLKLQKELEAILLQKTNFEFPFENNSHTEELITFENTNGLLPNVYYQPPKTKDIKYPCIIYGRENIKNSFANNKVMFQQRSYKVTVIDENPDSEIVTRVSQMNTCKFVTHFTSDGLNHDVFSLYY